MLSRVLKVIPRQARFVIRRGLGVNPIIPSTLTGLTLTRKGTTEM